MTNPEAHIEMSIVSKVRLFAAVSICAVGSFGQSEQPPPPTPEAANPPAQASPCPKVEIQNPANRSVHEGQQVTFVARVSGGDRTVVPSMLWNLSAGSIRDGQGTYKIEVDSTGAGAYRQIVADLWVGGYPPECTTQATAQTISVVPPAVKIDEFGELAVETEAERIANAVSAVSANNDTVYVIAYSGRTSGRGYASQSLRRIADQFRKAGITGRRLGGVDGGFREQPGFEFWVVPEGSEMPRPTPTIDRKEIVYPKTPPTRRVPAKRP